MRRIYNLLMLVLLLCVGHSVYAQNIIMNPDFDYGLDDWDYTDGTTSLTEGSDNLALVAGENGVLYQKVTDIDAGSTYTCVMEFTDMTIKQSTGYGYAIEKESAIAFPDFTTGATQLSTVCSNNDGLWVNPDPGLTGAQTITFDIIAPTGATAVYICIGTKGAIAKLKVTSVSLEEAQTNDVVFTVRNKEANVPLADAEITIDGIPAEYITGADGNVTISLIPSITPYQVQVERNWFQTYNTELTVSAATNSLLVELDSIQEIKDVRTRISKYGDNATPYPLYGHFWSDGLTYTSDEIETMTTAFDYAIGGSGLSQDSEIADQLHAANPDFQLIRYTGGWTRERSFAESHKLELAYYKIGALAAGIDANTTSFQITSAPTKGAGLIESEDDNFDIWIRVEDELMKVTNVSSTSTYPITVTVERGFDGTSALAHNAGATVTLPLYGTPPVEGASGGSISYFVTPYVARKYIIEDFTFSMARESHYDGIWIDILLGRLDAKSLFNNGYQEWDHATETGLNSVNDVKYTKEALDAIYTKFYSRMGYYPTIYGNNVLYASSLNSGSRAWAMVPEEGYSRVMDGFCHENSWGHVSSDGSGIDHEGQVVGDANSIKEYGSGDRYLEWYTGNTWLNNNKAIALLAQEGLPNQPMTINAGFKNQWFAESFTDNTRYRFNKYAYASYLMAVDVTADSSISCRMGISPMRVNGSTTIEIEPFFYLPIGFPTESYSYSNYTNYRHGSNNLYTRQFEYGLVLMNPFATSMTASVSIADITGTSDVYFDPENNYALVTSVQLDSLEVMILLNQQGRELGTDEVQQMLRSVEVYPNPASDVLTVRFANNQLNDTETIRIYSLNGIVMQQQVFTGNEEIQLNVSSLPAGVYFIRLANANQVIKFIKQ